MVDKVSSEDSNGKEQWRRCGTTGINAEVEEMWYSNRRDAEQRRWQNGLEERQRTRQILTENNYQLGVAAPTDMHGN